MTRPFRAVSASASASATGCAGGGKKRRLSGLAAPFVHPRAVRPRAMSGSSRSSLLLAVDEALSSMNYHPHSPPQQAGRRLSYVDNYRPITNNLPNGRICNQSSYIASMRTLDSLGQARCDFEFPDTTTTAVTDGADAKANEINVPGYGRVDAEVNNANVPDDSIAGATYNNPMVISSKNNNDINGDGNIEKQTEKPARLLSPIMKAMEQVKCCEGFKFEYTVEDRIGVGTYGVVLAVRSRLTNTQYAAKVAITRPNQRFNASIREFIAMEKFAHKNVVELHRSFDATSEGIPTKILVLNLANCGDLENFVYNAHNDSGYHPSMAVSITKQMLEGLDYIHWKGFAHCDFKPGNMLVSLQEGAALPRIQIADLGGVVELDTKGCVSEYFGTYAINAPEVFDLQSGRIKKINGRRADMWSLGCTIYFLITGGLYPFDGPSGEYDKAASKYNTRNGLLEWYDNLRVKNPYSAQFLIHSMLSMKPGDRFDCKVMLGHDWLCEDQELPDLPVPPPLRTRGSDWPITWKPDQDDEGNTEGEYVEGSVYNPAAL